MKTLSPCAGPVAKYRLILRLTFVLLLFVAAMSAQSLKVTTSDGNTTTFSAEDLASFAHVVVDVQDHGTPAQFQGIPLVALLQKAGLKFDAKSHVPAISDVIIVEASDGYKASFAIAEIDPSISSSQVVLADKSDGKPLDAKQGPLRIIATGDKRAARWVRQVTVVRVASMK